MSPITKIHYELTNTLFNKGSFTKINYYIYLTTLCVSSYLSTSMTLHNRSTCLLVKIRKSQFVVCISIHKDSLAQLSTINPLFTIILTDWKCLTSNNIYNGLYLGVFLTFFELVFPVTKNLDIVHHIPATINLNPI